MCTFICIGGLCFGATILNNHESENIKHLRSPINNANVLNGFIDTHKLFDGTFEKEVLSKKLVYKYKPAERFPHQFYSKSYRFIHLDLHDPRSYIKLRNRYNKTLEFINNPTDDYYFLYSLSKKDINLSVEEIEQQLKRLSQYIDINRIIFLGSIRYTGDLTEINGNPVSLAKFNYRNKNFEKVVGDRYMEIFPANCYNIAFDNFFNELCTRKLIDLEIATCKE